MNLGIKDRVAIVTGGSAGIGLAVVEELLENGAHVCVVARNEERLLASIRTLNVTSERVLAIVADVADPLSAVSIVDQTISKFGYLDILVNNAGRAHAGGLMSSTEDDWEDMTAVKLCGYAQALQGRHTCHAGAEMGTHRQHVLHRRNLSKSEAAHLSCAQRRHQQLHQVACA